MDLNPIIDRLKNNVAIFKLVGGSADIPSAEERLLNHPAAFVLPLNEVASSNQLAFSAISQLVTVNFGVLVAVRNVSDATGLASLTDLEAIRRSVKTQIMGWQPEADFEPITYVSGGLLKLSDDAVLWWMDSFTTAYYERVV
ncbi:MAG TPA: hypothetical protein DCG63_03740 [Methylophilaceae bacterium]|nr:hypothetical protein [Methylophilaceae bacterium]